MFQLIILVVIVVFVTIFAMDNLHHVELGIIAGKPVQVRMVFLLLTCYLLGFFSSSVLSLYKRARNGKPRKKAAEVDEEDYFTDE